MNEARRESTDNNHGDEHSTAFLAHKICMMELHYLWRELLSLRRSDGGGRGGVCKDLMAEGAGTALSEKEAEDCWKRDAGEAAGIERGALGKQGRPSGSAGVQADSEGLRLAADDLSSQHAADAHGDLCDISGTQSMT